jgi:hypothetical protein
MLLNMSNKLFLFGFVFLMFIGIGSAAVYDSNNTDIYECGVINESGSYIFNNSFVADSVNGACLEVMVSNVSIDGNSEVIDGNLNSSVGILAKNVSGLIIRDLDLMNFSFFGIVGTGISFFGVEDSNLENIEAKDNLVSGIDFLNSENIILEYSEVKNNGEGIILNGGTVLISESDIKDNLNKSLIVRGNGTEANLTNSMIDKEYVLDLGLGLLYRIWTVKIVVNGSDSNVVGDANITITRTEGNVSLVNLREMLISMEV